MISCFSNSSDWCILILADHSVICSLGSLLLHDSPVVVFFFNRGHPCFYSTIPVDVVRVNSYMNCLFDPARVVIMSSTCDYIVRQMKNLAFIVIHHNE